MRLILDKKGFGSSSSRCNELKESPPQLSHRGNDDSRWFVQEMQRKKERKREILHDQHHLSARKLLYSI